MRLIRPSVLDGTLYTTMVMFVEPQCAWYGQLSYACAFKKVAGPLGEQKPITIRYEM